MILVDTNQKRVSVEISRSPGYAESFAVNRFGPQALNRQLCGHFVQESSHVQSGN